MYETPWMALKADTHRLYGSYSFPLLVKGFLRNRNFRVILSLRICQIVANSNFLIKSSLLLFRFIHHIFTHNAGIDLSWRTKIGGGLAITHGWGLVVSPGATIGRNVTLFHGATIGRRDQISSDGNRVYGFPDIEDDVWIGPHAIIVGGISIGRGSRIAGGSFIASSVTAYSIVSGNPGVIVRNNCVPDVMNASPSLPISSQ